MSLGAGERAERRVAYIGPTRGACPLFRRVSQFPSPEADHEESESKANKNDPRNEKWPSARKAEG